MKFPRLRFTILMILAVVAFSALAINWYRPISQGEAEKNAEAKFLEIPGSNRWDGSYKVQARSAGFFEVDRSQRYVNGWTVVVSGKGDDELYLMTMFLKPKGKMRAVDFAFGIFSK